MRILRAVTKSYVTMVERGAHRAISFLVRVALADGIPILEVVKPTEAETLQLVERAVTLGGAEGVVWGLQRCLKRWERPTGSKTGAALVIHKVMLAQPERKAELEALRSRLNELFPYVRKDAPRGARTPAGAKAHHPEAGEAGPMSMPTVADPITWRD